MAYRIVLLPVTFSDRQGYFGYGRSKNKSIYKSDLHAVLGFFYFHVLCSTKYVANRAQPLQVIC